MFTRREFLKGSFACGVFFFLSDTLDMAGAANKAPGELSFSFVCGASDNHLCKLKAIVRDGAVIRIEADGRMLCSKGLALHKELYSPNRLTHPLIRKGWLKWADDGFPKLDNKKKEKYFFNNRDRDKFVRVSWDEAFSFAAKGMIHIAERYSVRAFKLNPGHFLSGVLGKGGLIRFANLLSVLDSTTRDVTKENAKGAAVWLHTGSKSSAEAYPHGLEAQKIDWEWLKYSKLLIITGTNILESMIPLAVHLAKKKENGCKIVCISPEDSPTSIKSHYSLKIRGGTDAALFLGISKLIIDEGFYNEEFLLQHTDFNTFIREDNLKRLKEQGNYLTSALLEGEKSIKTGLGFVKASTLFRLYKLHLKDYDLQTVSEITGVPKDIILRLKEDIKANQPFAVIYGKGIKDRHNASNAIRSLYLPLVLTGNIGVPGSGCFTNEGNYISKFQIADNFTKEDPFNPGKIKSRIREEAAFSDTVPHPAKLIWAVNSNIFKSFERKDYIENLELIISQDIRKTATTRNSDIIFPANSWLEQESTEISVSRSNGDLLVWKGGISPKGDTKDDLTIISGVAKKLSVLTKDDRFAEYFKDSNNPKFYMDRISDVPVSANGKVSGISPPTTTGKVELYNESDKFIKSGENFIVHREGACATPYLPNIIVSSNPFIRAKENVKMKWKELKVSRNPLFQEGYKFQLLTKKSRHHINSQFMTSDIPVIYIHPETADSLKIKEGNHVEIELFDGKIAKKKIKVQIKRSFSCPQNALLTSAQLMTPSWSTGIALEFSEVLVRINV